MKTRYIAIALLLSPSLAFANNAAQPVPTEMQTAPTSMMMQPQMMAESAATSQQTNPQQMNVQPNMMQGYMVAPQAMMQSYPVAHHGVILIAPAQANYSNQGMMQGQQPMMQHYMTPASSQMMNGQPVMMPQMMTPQPRQIGGFVGPQHIIDNIAAAQKANNDSPVELTGNIIASLGNDQYQFKDNSGVITLDISPENFNGLTVTPASTITIQGEVDKEWGNCIIDVDSVNQA